jgi:thiamine-phosphate pyrophosphorylase
MEDNIMRAIDANLNRVAEGLRVVEDIVRFCFDDGPLVEQIKALRHELAAIVSAKDCLASRRPLADVGFGAKGALEYERHDLKDLLRANFKRAQEGLRSLEELSKLTDEKAPARFKALRYAVYEVERATAARITGKVLEPGLYLVLSEPRDGYERLTEMAVQAGLPAVQLRYKGSDGRRFLELARSLRRITAGSRTLFMINDRPDIALLADADGVHVGQEDLAPEMVRKLIGPQKLLGLSTHNLDQVRASLSEPVDYIGFGPLYATSSKAKPDPVVGPQALAAAARISSHPIVGIGGLTLERIAELGPKTFHNVAVITAVSRADDPLAAMAAIHKKSLERL